MRYQTLVLTHCSEEAVEEHREMFEAAPDRDAGRATATLRSHIEKGLKHALSAL